MTAINNAPITDAELDTLEAFIFSESVSEESLDLIGIHGFMCALNISPVATDEAQWLEILFDGTPEWQSAEQEKEIKDILRHWKAAIDGDLYNDRDLEMPCDLTLVVEDGEQAADVEIWAQAFMEGVFLNEEAWYDGKDGRDEKAAEMILPIMVVSDLFDEKEFRELRNNIDVCEQMASQIPELLIDLYLLYHAPEK